jgi:hypothetical protein
VKIREVSDVHTEFFGEDEIAQASLRILPPLPDDKETVLLLAGDIGAMGKPECLVNFLDAVCPRFEMTLYIPGNHEYYHGDIQRTPDDIRDLTKHIPNLYFDVAGGAITHQGPKIHMHTLWTDFDKENEMAMYEASRRMNDYRLIMNGKHIFTPKDALNLHKWHMETLGEEVNEGDVVMTHHSPSLLGIPAAYLHDRVNGAYHSDLSEFILRKKPRLWFFGHTHTATRFKLGDTELICNPRGYGNQHKTNGYDPILAVEV